MKKKSKLFFAIITCCFLFSSVQAASAKQSFRIHSLIVFGDGGMDNGNTYHEDGFPVMPPYWNGRFSNGPVAAEYLADQLNLIADPLQNPNYNRHQLFVDISYFGMVVLKKNAIPITEPPYTPPTFAEEVNQYLSSSPHNYPASSLVLVEVGSNDFIAPICLASPLTCLQQVISGIIAPLDMLAKRGFTHFLIVTPGAYSTEPGFSYLDPAAKQSDLYNVLSQNYLREFSNIKVQLEDDDPQVRVALYNQMHDYSALIREFSIPVSFPCYKNDAAIYNRQVGPVCTNPNQHLYFDSFFYSSRGHRLFAQSIHRYLIKIGWARGQSTLHWWQRL